MGINRGLNEKVQFLIVTSNPRRTGLKTLRNRRLIAAQNRLCGTWVLESGAWLMSPCGCSAGVLCLDAVARAGAPSVFARGGDWIPAAVQSEAAHPDLSRLGMDCSWLLCRLKVFWKGQEIHSSSSGSDLDEHDHDVAPAATSRAACRLLR